MKLNYKVLIILLGICFGSLGFAIIISSLESMMLPPNGNDMMPLSIVSYMGSNVNPLLAYVFFITLIIVIIYSAFIFRQKIMRILS
ncbi:exported protein of unknown function [Candidatus Nitrosotalea okcheonensis]|uniref:Uncharacterized protein n=1 Tax=Candidatus Nitrosotalea okcheonensis TaxID=1903276 RepID=A0A2H1FD43_9ARCH|nr:exported protein of unknown function [Candidatus Nitrosotalea okcheonensis]